MPGTVRPVAGERDALLAYLDHQRHLVRVAVHGIDEGQARATPSASSLSLGGIVKHLAMTERSWIDLVLQRPQQGSVEEYMNGFRLGDDATLAGTLADYEAAARETTAAIAGIADLGQEVPVPKGVPWYPPDVDAWSVRWVLLHLIEETARHLGHAEIVRESLDGATAIPLMAAAEGWEATSWVTPWRPAPPAVAR
jgi:uncharacterized damage-inducible protein DinB